MEIDCDNIVEQSIDPEADPVIGFTGIKMNICGTSINRRTEEGVCQFWRILVINHNAKRLSHLNFAKFLIRYSREITCACLTTLWL